MRKRNQKKETREETVLKKKIMVSTGGENEKGLQKKRNSMRGVGGVG